MKATLSRGYARLDEKGHLVKCGTRYNGAQTCPGLLGWISEVQRGPAYLEPRRVRWLQFNIGWAFSAPEGCNVPFWHKTRHQAYRETHNLPYGYRRSAVEQRHASGRTFRTLFPSPHEYPCLAECPVCGQISILDAARLGGLSVVHEK